MQRNLASRIAASPISLWDAGRICAVVTVVGWVIGWGTDLIAQETSFKPFEKESSLQKFTREFDMVRLQAKKGRLAPKFDAEVQTARSQIQKLISRLPGRSGLSSSSSGGGQWSVVSRATDMTIAAGYGLSNVGGSQMGVPEISDLKNAFWVNLVELRGDQHELLIKAKKNGSLAVEIENGSGSYLFRFNQQASGGVVCLELGSDVAFSGSAPNFNEFAMKYPEYVQQRLSPIFQFAGIGEPPHRYHPVVRQHVLSLLRPIDPARKAEFQTLVETMNVGNYEARQKATDELDARFSQWRDEIKNAISDTEMSTEIRSRLKKIYEQQVKETERDYREIAIQYKFHQDPAYLVWLLSVTQGDDDDSLGNRDLIVAALETATGQSFGDDVTKWQHWAGQETGVAVSDDASHVDVLATDGVLEVLSLDIGNMLRLQVIEGMLKLDREHWSDQYDGKSVKELTADLEQYLEDHHLPRQWIQSSGQYPVSSFGYPQLIFDRMVEGLKPDSQNQQRINSSRSYQQSTRNRGFSGVSVDVSLEMHPRSNTRRVIRMVGGIQRSATVPKEEYFRFRVSEKRKEKRSVEVRAGNDGIVMIDVGFAKEESMIRMVQTAKPNAEGIGCFLFDVRGEKVTILSAKNFSELRAGHSEYFEEYFDPVLEKFGVKIGESGE